MGQMEDMDTFVRIVELGGISRAADQMGIAKSAVSRRLRELENRLGFQLLVRTTQHSSLTEAGQRYYERSVEILAEVAELNNSSAEQHSSLQGTLKVALPISFGLAQIAPLITEFADLHPDITMRIEFSDRQVDLVEEGYDLAVRVATLKDSTYVARKLMGVSRVLCASPGYVERYGVPNSPADLRHHCGLQYTVASNRSWAFKGPNGQEIRAAAPISIASNNGEFLLEAALQGRGVGMFPKFMVWQALNDGALVEVMPEYSLSSLNAYTIHPETRYLAHRVRALIDFLVKQCKVVPDWEQ